VTLPFQGLFAGGEEANGRAQGARRGLRDDQMTDVNRIERAAEEGVHGAQCAADVESGGQLLAVAASAG